jgi:hypothetical protein
MKLSRFNFARTLSKMLPDLLSPTRQKKTTPEWSKEYIGNEGEVKARIGLRIEPPTLRVGGSDRTQYQPVRRLGSLAWRLVNCTPSGENGLFPLLIVIVSGVGLPSTPRLLIGPRARSLKYLDPYLGSPIPSSFGFRRHAWSNHRNSVPVVESTRERS